MERSQQRPRSLQISTILGHCFQFSGYSKIKLDGHRTLPCRPSLFERDNLIIDGLGGKKIKYTRYNSYLNLIFVIFIYSF